MLRIHFLAEFANTHTRFTTLQRLGTPRIPNLTKKLSAPHILRPLQRFDKKCTWTFGSPVNRPSPVATKSSCRLMVIVAKGLALLVGGYNLWPRPSMPHFAHTQHEMPAAPKHKQ